MEENEEISLMQKLKEIDWSVTLIVFFISFSCIFPIGLMLQSVFWPAPPNPKQYEPNADELRYEGQYVSVDGRVEFDVTFARSETDEPNWVLEGKELLNLKDENFPTLILRQVYRSEYSPLLDDYVSIEVNLLCDIDTPDDLRQCFVSVRTDIPEPERPPQGER